MSQQTGKQQVEDELADVVVAKNTQDAPLVPWHVTLRPWLFCLAFLLIVEMVTRLYFDTTLCLETERFDNYPTPASENAFVAQMRRDTAYKVVMIGDSTVVGSALLDKYQTTPRYLEEALRGIMPNREIHVWNFSVAGARGSDELCLLQKVMEGKPDFLILQGNYYITAMGLKEHAIAEPWLAYNLPSIPPSVQPYLPPRDLKQRFEDALTQGIENNIRFVGMRQTINAKLFGVQPRIPYPNPNPFVMSGVTIARHLHRVGMQTWDARGLSAEQFLKDYKNDITPEDLNGHFYHLMVEEAQRTGLPCMTYLTPQNPQVTSTCLPLADYRKGRETLGKFLTMPGVVFRDYSELVPQEQFHDNDHLMASGNHALADALAAEIAPRIRSVISTEGRTAHVANRR